MGIIAKLEGDRLTKEKDGLIISPRDQLKILSAKQEKQFYRESLRVMLRGALMLAWARKTFVNYVELAEPFRLFSGGMLLAGALGEIMEEDVLGDSALLSTLVVSSTNGIPGSGYFGKATLLGIFNPMKETQFSFWLRQADFLGMKTEAIATASAAGWLMLEDPMTATAPSGQ